MIVIGVRNIASKVDTGTFDCPNCGAQQMYTRQAVKEWLTLYFIPVIPLGRQGEQIKCASCGDCFASEVLNYDPAADRAEGAVMLRRITTLALAEAGRLGDENVAALCKAIAKIGDMPCDVQDIAEDCRLALEAGAKLRPFAQQTVKHFTESGRVQAVMLAIHALRGSGELDDRCHRALNELAEGLMVAPEAVQQLVAQESDLVP